MAEHTLTIRPSEDHDPEYPDWRWEIACVTPEKCNGWTECMETHEVDGRDAGHGPWQGPEDAPWFEEEEFTFHGVEHEWRYGYGWTVPYEGCVVADFPDLSDDVYEIARQRGPGTYPVDDDWDDDTCYLTVIAEEVDRG